jgi:hypothetical protein
VNPMWRNPVQAVANRVQNGVPGQFLSLACCACTSFATSEARGEQVGTAAESKRVIHATVIGRRHSNP